MDWRNLVSCWGCCSGGLRLTILENDGFGFDGGWGCDATPFSLSSSVLRLTPRSTPMCIAWLRDGRSGHWLWWPGSEEGNDTSSMLNIESTKFKRPTTELMIPFCCSTTSFKSFICFSRSNTEKLFGFGGWETAWHWSTKTEGWLVSSGSPTADMQLSAPFLFLVAVRAARLELEVKTPTADNAKNDT